jgi:hypothetical protein
MAAMVADVQVGEQVHGIRLTAGSTDACPAILLTSARCPSAAPRGFVSACAQSLYKVTAAPSSTVDCQSHI